MCEIPGILAVRLMSNIFAVGGIYSVLKSKAPVTTAEYGERYTLIGPLNHQSVSSAPALFIPVEFLADLSRLLSKSRSSSQLSQNWPLLSSLCEIAASVYFTGAG